MASEIECLSDVSDCKLKYVLIDYSEYDNIIDEINRIYVLSNFFITHLRLLFESRSVRSFLDNLSDVFGCDKKRFTVLFNGIAQSSSFL